MRNPNSHCVFMEIGAIALLSSLMLFGLYLFASSGKLAAIVGALT